MMILVYYEGVVLLMVDLFGYLYFIYIYVGDLFIFFVDRNFKDLVSNVISKEVFIDVISSIEIIIFWFN